MHNWVFLPIVCCAVIVLPCPLGFPATWRLFSACRAAPELLWGERCSEKADIYSFGGHCSKLACACLEACKAQTVCPARGAGGEENGRVRRAGSPRKTPDDPVHSFIQRKSCGCASLPGHAGILLWEICSGERPVRGQLRDLR